MKLIVLASLLLIHDFYDRSCCNEKDCRPVKCEDITHENGEWAYRHVLTSRSNIKPSPDGRCHACFLEDEHGEPIIYRLYCIYLPGTV